MALYSYPSSGMSFSHVSPLPTPHPPPSGLYPSLKARFGILPSLSTKSVHHIFLTFSLSFSQNPSATLYLTSFLICVSRFRARHSCSKKPLLSLPWALLSYLDRGPVAILFAPYTSVPGLGLPFIFCLLFLFSQDIVTSL